MTAVRHFPVGISVEQLASSWARTEAAPAGATVVVDHEIGGRQRLGIPWKVLPPNAFACAVILRPEFRSEVEAILWVVGLVAAAKAADVCPGWPDLLFDSASNQVGAVGLEVQLNGGSIASAIVSLRLDLGKRGSDASLRESLTSRFAAEVQRGADLANDKRADLLQEYSDTSCLIDKRVRAKLLPKGETRGKAAAIDPLGLLVLESPTGMLERLSPVGVFRVDVAG